ncbi:MAG: aminopeptidase N [Gammaproteobacteria bacterium]|nr:aminopeptidase N [Gammaproteobacteria bacterium]
MLTALVALVGCAPELPPETAPRAALDALSHSDAQARGARLGNVAYQLYIDLTGVDAGPDTFTGEARLTFELKTVDQALTVDFSGAQNLLVTLNGELANIPYNGYFLTLPRSLLRRGPNELVVRYAHTYSRDGTGLHRFVDPEDGATYLYTYLWPYYANRLLPLFDQPDVKARYSLKVRAPDDWIVASAGSGEKQAADAGSALWSFAQTPPISSYVFSLHAGPYQVWEDAGGEIPLRLMARRSLAPHVAVDEWFAVTRGGLEFFAGYFELPYPFEKYDQLIVPDFNIGAMENIAAVTINEQYVQRQPSTYAQREGRAEVILHEMAHMWFGNLVTHRWWNGLWLNESFATQMAHLALIDTTSFVSAWHRFFTVNKQRAYHRDSRVTTHPVEMPIASTAEFFTVFDAITYEKGSSALKQLAHFVGAERYRRGVAEYLKTHAYSNTELADFITSQARTAERPLDDWASQWLDTVGYNSLQADFSCVDGELSALTVEQSAESLPPALRVHRVDIGLYGLEGAERGGSLQLSAVLPAEIRGATSSIDVPEGTQCPVLVFPNHDDWTYATVTVAAAHLETIVDRLQQVADPLARSMLVQVLADRARAGDMPIAAFIDVAAANAEIEADLLVLSQLVDLLGEFVALLERLGATADLDVVAPRLEALSWQKAAAAPDGDLRRLWFGLHIAVGRSDEGLKRLVGLLDGTESMPGLDVSVDLRWQLLVHLSAQGVAGIDDRIAGELQRDPSDLGEKRAIAARAAWPDLQSKRRWLGEILDPESRLGLARKRFAIFNLFPPNQTELQQQLLPMVLQPLPELSRSADHYFMASYVDGLLAPVCSATSTGLMGDYLDADLSSTALRFLREAHQADAECASLGNGIR